MIRSRPILAFLLLAYGISWGIFALAKWGLGITGALGWTIASSLFMLGPALAVLLLRRPMGLSWTDLGVVRHGIRWKWMGMAVLVAMALPPVTLLVNWIAGDVLHIAAFGRSALTKDMLLHIVGGLLAKADAPPGSSAASMKRIADLPLNGPALMLMFLLVGAVAGCTVNFVFAMGEELGWRGLLFQLTRKWGLLGNVLFTGLYWGLWHAPLILHGHNYPDHPMAGVAFMCLFTTATAFPMAVVRARSRCVWSAGILHGTVNGVAGVGMLFSEGGSPILNGGAGLSAVIALVAIGSTLYFLLPEKIREELL